MYNNYPFNEIALAMKEHVEKGNDVYQKFTCDKCGSRQTMGEKNVMYTKGRCEECNHVTDIVKTGCNYLVYGQYNNVMDMLKE